MKQTRLRKNRTQERTRTLRLVTSHKYPFHPPQTPTLIERKIQVASKRSRPGSQVQFQHQHRPQSREQS